jgi:hypothetical protein
LWNRPEPATSCMQNRCSSNRASTQKKDPLFLEGSLCYFICAFNLAIPRRSFQSHIGPGHNYYCYVYCCVHWKCFCFILKAKCNTSCINYQTLFNFLLVYNLMCLCLICQILSFVFYKMSVIYVPLFNFNVIVLVWQKKTCSALRILFA